MGPYGVPGSLSMGHYGVPGSRDSGSWDLGSQDSGSRDLGSRDSGSRDLGSRDLGSLDLWSLKKFHEFISSGFQDLLKSSPRHCQTISKAIRKPSPNRPKTDPKPTPDRS